MFFTHILLTSFTTVTCLLNLPNNWDPSTQPDLVSYFAGILLNTMPTILIFYFGYCIGFFDGEGSVIARITKDTERNYRIRMALTITQKDKRSLALNLFVKLFGCGSIYNQTKTTLEFRVDSLATVGFLCNLLLLGSLVKRKQLQLMNYLVTNYTTLVLNPKQFLINCYIVNFMQTLNDSPLQNNRIKADTIAIYLVNKKLLTKQQSEQCKVKAKHVFDNLT